GAVTARVALPGIAAGAALVLLTCMKELPVTLLLHPTGTDTLAVTAPNAGTGGRPSDRATSSSRIGADSTAARMEPMAMGTN
ncbi:hypothetical protein C6A85_13640, partial [Mycobacterium sp. ITM-2017-0098]